LLLALPPCETSDTLQLGRQTLELIACTTDQWSSAAGSDWTESRMHGTLVAKPGGVVADLGNWSNGWEWGSSWKFDGWLVAPTGERAVVVEADEHEVQMTGAHVAAFVVGPTPWQELTIASGSSVDIEVSADHRRATLTAHDVDDLSGSDRVTTAVVHFDGTSITP
jgi:hypothetical protein